MQPSAHLIEILTGYARGRFIKMSLVALLGVAMLAGVAVFAFDMYLRAQANPMGPGFGHWVCAIIGGLPSILVLLYGGISAGEQLAGGGPDVRFLRERWADLRSARIQRVTYTMKGGAVGSTSEVILTLAGGETTALTLPSNAADRVQVLIAAELMSRDRNATKPSSS